MKMFSRPALHCVFFKSFTLLAAALMSCLSGCASEQLSHSLTVFSRIEFEFLTHSNNAVFGLQQRPLVLPDRPDVPVEFKNPLPRCTGFFVAPKIFVTAFHCVPNLQVARFDYLSRSSDWLQNVAFSNLGRISFVGRAQDSKLYPLSGDDLLWTNSDLDVALVRWPHAVEHGVLTVCQSDYFKEPLPQKIQLLGFPQGLPLSRSVGEVHPMRPSVSTLLFAHDADSLAGESGGPVLIFSESEAPCVAGVHIRGGGSNQFTHPLVESQQLSAAQFAENACRSEPVEQRSSCEESYRYNKAVRIDQVLNLLKVESAQLWQEVVKEELRAR